MYFNKLIAWTAGRMNGLGLFRLPLVASALVVALSAPSALALDDGIPQGWMIIEGDIVVPDDYYTNPAPWLTSFWTGGVVPYSFHGNMSTDMKVRAIAAMSEWGSLADLQFTLRTTQANYILFRDSDGNNSQVGMVGGEQIINIVNWSTHYKIVHELAHSLGFWHEQSRTDRDNYVQINYANICQDCCSGGPCDNNFNKASGSGRYGPYNFDSVMHYGQYSFTSNGSPTIEVLPPYDVEWQNAIGQRDHMSTWDGYLMSFIYRESNWRFVDWSDLGSTESGSFFEPINDFWLAVSVVPSGGTVIVLEPDSAIGPGVITKAMILRAPVGEVVIR